MGDLAVQSRAGIDESVSFGGWPASVGIPKAMPTRLLAVDLDGTLLTSERTPHPVSAAALRAAQDSGVMVVLASGRIRPTMLPIAAEAGVCGPMICGNGAHVVDAEGLDIAHWPVPKAVYDVIWPYALEVGAHVNVYTRTELIFLSESEFGEEYARRLRTMEPTLLSPEEAREKEITKVLVMDHPERIPTHRKRILEMIDPQLGRATESEPDYLEFFATGVSKGLALKTLAEHLGIEQSECAAIGDYLNDAEMLEWAGVSATVANGHPALKSIASMVVASNEEAGVAEFVEHLLGSR